MKANFKIISTLLIIFLTILLIAIVISYYNAPVEVNNIYLENIADTDHDEVQKVISENVSGEIISSSSDPESSGDVSGEENSKTILPESKGEGKSTQVIITSDDTMTNKEKREILTELDNTLMELLDAVDKVQTIDESRLIIDESGVQE